MNVYVATFFGDRGSAADIMNPGAGQVLNANYCGIAQCDIFHVWAAQPVGGKRAE
jgi:hypothetical protein